MEIMATSKNYGKKKVRITSGICWTLMGKNPIMEKSDAGAACLSWTFFFHNSVGYHTTIFPMVVFWWLPSRLRHDGRLPTSWGAKSVKTVPVVSKWSCHHCEIEMCLYMYGHVSIHVCMYIYILFICLFIFIYLFIGYTRVYIYMHK